MRDGRALRDDERIERTLAEEAAGAEALASAGDALAAGRKLTEIGETFAGLASQGAVERAALRAAEFVRGDPAGARTIGVVSQASGASARTLERLFVRETGMAIGAWRQRARLLHSLAMLSDGDSVTHAALTVGYASTSAYVAAFKSVLGMTPGAYRQSR